jgi:hypothetical protein
MNKPGDTLEAFVMSTFNLVVEGHKDSNWVEKAYGPEGRQRRGLIPTTQEEFAPILALFERYREETEYAIEHFDFDDLNRSWDDYVYQVSQCPAPEAFSTAETMVDELLEKYKAKVRKAKKLGTELPRIGDVNFHKDENLLINAIDLMEAAGLASAQKQGVGTTNWAAVMITYLKHVSDKKKETK